MFFAYFTFSWMHYGNQMLIKLCITMNHHYFFMEVLTKITMNIQPADILRVLGEWFCNLKMTDLCKILLFILIQPINKIFRCLRQCWVQNWILERPLFGQYEFLMDQLLNSDMVIKTFVRLSPKLFRELVERVEP